MKEIKVIINPDFQEGEKPGQFLEIKIKVKDDYSKLTLERAIAKRLRYTVSDD